MSALVAVAQTGHVVSFPTDTVPALAAKPEQADQIFALKQRSYEKPLILMGANAEQLWPFINTAAMQTDDTALQAVFTEWQLLAQRFWPGSLTLVLPAQPDWSNPLNPQNPKTLGIRVPNQPIALDILRQTGPLATTSANLSGQPALETLSAIAATFPDVYVLDLKVQPMASGQPSTVLQWQPSGWRVLRLGAIRSTDLPQSVQDSLVKSS
ncbi:MAG: L-threonylcarbamoyladenylate synthase [Cyanobacteria bacterium P01_H01_bin.121]